MTTSRVLAMIWKVGAQNWQVYERPLFEGRPEYTNISTKHMFLLID